MRKICLLLTILGAFSCSTDQDELGLNSEQIQEVDAVIEVAGCAVITYDFDDAGIIEVTNDATNLYVTVVANTGYVLNMTRLHVANNVEEFPTVGNGNLPPAKMELLENFEGGTSHHTFTLSLEEYGDEDGTISIASFSTFSGMGNSHSEWAGDIDVKYGNWSYFNYDICEPLPQDDPCNYIQGESYSTSLTYAEVTDGRFPSEVAIRDFYIDLIEEEGINRFGIFQPSIEDIRDEWDGIKGDLSNFPYDLTTVYTVGSGDCRDSVTLTLTITP